LRQQYTERHPYTGADPGGWAWTDLPGGVPDADDTPGALLALQALSDEVCLPLSAGLQPVKCPPYDAALAAINWLARLRNRDGGWPTFCRGWGKLPFDRSGADLTAHALRAWRVPGYYISMNARELIEGYGLAYLARQQRPDGSWLPLWFGNQHAPDDENPTYGTARVLAAYRDLGLMNEEPARRGVAWLVANQNDDGGWGGGRGTPSSVEESALAVEVLIAWVAPPHPNPPPQGGRGKDAVEEGGEATDARSDFSPPPLWGRVRVGGSEPATTPNQIAVAVDRGVAWLVNAVESGALINPSPIGFYFAKLWYFERLYPIIFSVAALGRACRHSLTR
jgi:squalene-hopene/tetraprenyl-beta-curcumene cyclase